MSTRFTGRLLFAVILAGTFIGTTERAASAHEFFGHRNQIPVIAVGCLQRESDYRRDHHRARGGFLHTGGGVGNEYILLNATVGRSAMHVRPGTEEESHCVGHWSGFGQNIELTGHGEGALRGLVGRRVVIYGMLKHAKHDMEAAYAVGTSGTFTPVSTNGGPWPGDLRLREINVDSHSLAPVYFPPPVAEVPHPAPPPIYPQAPPIPDTASELPLIGLIGLLMVGSAIGLRAFGRHRTRI